MNAQTIIDGPPPPIAPDVVNRDAAGRATIRAIKLSAALNLDGRLDDEVYTTILAYQISSSKYREKARRRPSARNRG